MNDMKDNEICYLSCNELVKRYKKENAIDNITFTVNEPCLLGLIGNNGAGKTTLMRIWAGQYVPSEGRVTVLGRNPMSSYNVATNMILVDDTMAYQRWQTIGNVFKECAIRFPNWDNDKAVKLAGVFGLSLKKTHLKYSKGMVSTINVVIGLAANCAITLLDEPTTGMDARVRSVFYQVIINEYIENPRVIVISSHLIGELEKVFTEIVIMRTGKVIYRGSVEELASTSYRLYGDKKIIEKVVQPVSIMKETQVFSKYQYDIMGTISEKDLEFMSHNGVEYEHLSLNDSCIYLCNDGRVNADLTSVYAELKK